MTMNNDDKTVVHGAEAIAKVIGETDIARVRYLLKNGYIPGAQRLGKRRWILSVRTWFKAVHGEG